MVRLLLKSGAKVDYRANTNEEFPRTTQCDEPLRLAIRNKHYEIARLLLEHGADPNKRYFFGSEINLVTDLEFLELLLTFGANPDSRDRAGLTPLMKAVRQPGVNIFFNQPHDIRGHFSRSFQCQSAKILGYNATNFLFSINIFK